MISDCLKWILPIEWWVAAGRPSCVEALREFSTPNSTESSFLPPGENDADIWRHQMRHELFVLLIRVCIIIYLSRVCFFFVLDLYFSFLVPHRLCGEQSKSVSLFKAWYCTEKGMKIINEKKFEFSIWKFKYESECETPFRDRILSVKPYPNYPLQILSPYLYFSILS